MSLGVASHYAATIAYDRKGYWFNAGNKAVNWALRIADIICSVKDVGDCLNVDKG